jgi:TRAP transporter TAXI family solute receptor
MALAAASMLALAGFAFVSFGAAQTSVQHISFVLATGSTGGTYFPVGQAIAEIISHPPGVARCDIAELCGPPGLVATIRSSQGSVANVLDVDADRADSALAQSDIVFEALAGKGDFRDTGPQSHVRVIADLFPEEVHLVAARGADIRSVSELKGKRVAMGTNGSGTSSTALRLACGACHEGLQIPDCEIVVMERLPRPRGREPKCDSKPLISHSFDSRPRRGRQARTSDAEFELAAPADIRDVGVGGGDGKA